MQTTSSTDLVAGLRQYIQDRGYFQLPGYRGSRDQVTSARLEDDTALVIRCGHRWLFATPAQMDVIRTELQTLQYIA